MPIPTPEYPLEDACSAIFNNTLYTYTPKALQSLRLEQGAEWAELPMGVSVEGGVCVESTPTNDTSAAALYIVGGKANDSNYEGLQRYNFASGKWETISPTVPITQNRLYHNAAYLNISDSILVFSGTQDGSKQASTQTFTIQASEPYDVVAYEADVPPAISPILIPWTQSKAIYIGGSETNKKAMTFSYSNSWEDSNATLAEALYNSTVIKGIVINGNDASKNLYLFDLSVAPNSVSRTILVDGDGNPVQNAKPVVSRDLGGQELDERSLDRRGNLTVENWPPYNGTLAPSSTRTSYSVARDQSGLTVISGGNNQDVLCMFKATDNCWLNATEKLTGKSTIQQGLGIAPSSTEPTTSQTASSTATAASAASVASGDSPFPVKILGAVLGSILGAAVILIALLFLMRWRRRRREYADAGHQRRSSGIPDEKGAMDFADMGMPHSSSSRQFRGHEAQDSQGSFSSMAILMDRVGHKRGGDKANGSTGSDSSSQFNKKYKTAISKPIPQEQPATSFAEPIRDEKPMVIAEERGPAPRPRGSSRGGRRGSTRRSSGWNRYWSGGSALNILGFGTKRATYEDGASDRSSDSHSHYSDQRMPSQITQASAMVPPLRIGDRPEMHRVVSGSPTVAHGGNFPITKEMSGQIERSGSVSSMSSYNDRHDAFSSGVPESVHEKWTPMEGQHWGDGRAQSNAYLESNYATTVGRPSIAQFLPRDTRMTRFPSAPATQQRQPPQTHVTQHSSDMSWLNLGGEQRI